MMGDRLMSTPPQFVLSRLSRQLYLNFLDKARSLGFAFIRFDAFLPGAAPLPDRFIALRHDIDFAPIHSVEMAELEHAAGIASTFFVLVDGQYYDPLRAEVVRQLRQIHLLGHEIGLHFAVSSSVTPDLGSEVALRMEVLSAIIGAPVRSFSQHDPVNAGFASVALPAAHHTCVDVSEVIRAHDLLYVSDSAMMWRHHTFETALDENRNLCLLAHPHSWLHGEDDYIAMIRDFQSQRVQEVNERFDTFVNALANYYTRRTKEGV